MITLSTGVIKTDTINLPRIAIFLPDLEGAGAQRVLFNLGLGMAERGYPVDLVLVKAKGAYLEQTPPSVNIVNLNAQRAASSLRPLIRYLRRTRPDVLLTGVHVNVIALWAKRLARTPTRVVISEHNTISVEVQNAKNRRARSKPLMAKWFYPWADAIIAVSQGVADDLSATAAIDQSKIEVIYNPVITPDLQEKRSSSFHDPWFEPGQPPVVLGVGRLTAQKDFGNLIEAFAQVHHKREARLIILGEGEDRATLEAQIRDLNLTEFVRLHGFTTNPYAFMARAQVFTLSSRWEGLPTVLIEALYCSPAVVSTDCPSGPREILQGGRFGELVPTEDSDALAAGILKALDRKVPSPPAESWRPYELDSVVERYLKTLLP